MTNARVGEHTLYVYLKAKEQHHVLTASIKGLVVTMGGGLNDNTKPTLQGYPKFCLDLLSEEHHRQEMLLNSLKLH